MDTLLVRPTFDDYSADPEAYAALQRALEAEGFEVVLQRPSQTRGPLDAVASVAVYLFENADNVAATAIIVEYLRRHLSRERNGPSPPRRRARVYDQEHELLKEVDLDSAFDRQGAD